MENVIAKEAAEAELDRILGHFGVEPDGNSWADSRARLLGAIGKGRIVLDEGKSAIVMTLAAPIDLENGGTLDELTFSEPTANDLKVLDKYKDNEKMAKTIHLASQMNRQPIGVTGRMKARDLQVMGAIAELFF